MKQFHGINGLLGVPVSKRYNRLPMDDITYRPESIPMVRSAALIKLLISLLRLINLPISPYYWHPLVAETVLNKFFFSHSTRFHGYYVSSWGPFFQTVFLSLIRGVLITELIRLSSKFLVCVSYPLGINAWCKYPQLCRFRYLFLLNNGFDSVVKLSILFFHKECVMLGLYHYERKQYLIVLILIYLFMWMESILPFCLYLLSFCSQYSRRYVCSDRLSMVRYGFPFFVLFFLNRIFLGAKLKKLKVPELCQKFVLL